MRQVITVHPDGTASGLQRKPGQGVDLRALGACAIKRASEIAWFEEAQRWHVQVLHGRMGGNPMTLPVWQEFVGATCPEGAEPIGTRGTLFFVDYDQAVAAEVVFLDALRLHGGV